MEGRSHGVISPSDFEWPQGAMAMGVHIQGTNIAGYSEYTQHRKLGNCSVHSYYP